MPSEIENDELAGRLSRLFAALLDAVIVVTASTVIVVVLSLETFLLAAGFGQVLLVALPPALYAFFNASLLAGSGQTVGKWVLNVRIVDQHTHQVVPVWNSLVLRYLLWNASPALLFPLLALLGLSEVALLAAGILWLDVLCIFGSRRRCLHDLVAGTIVVRADVTSLQLQGASR